MGDDAPDDELNRLSRKPAQNFGFPYCHADGVPDQDMKKADACDGVTLPVATMGPHAAAMGVHFYTGSMFPAEYRNAMFVARKGSWNRTQEVRLRRGHGARRSRRQERAGHAVHDRLHRIRPTSSFWGRPAYFLQMPDGSLLVSDEQLGAIYRISYAR